MPGECVSLLQTRESAMAVLREMEEGLCYAPLHCFPQEILSQFFFLSIITLYLCIPTLTGRDSFSWLISITSKRFLQEDRSKWWSNPSYTETLLARLVVDWLLVTACLLEPSYLRFQFRQVISSFKEKKTEMKQKKKNPKISFFLFVIQFM